MLWRSNVGGNYKEVEARHEWGGGLIGKKPDLIFGSVSYRKNDIAE